MGYGCLPGVVSLGDSAVVMSVGDTNHAVQWRAAQLHVAVVILLCWIGGPDPRNGGESKDNVDAGLVIVQILRGRPGSRCSSAPRVLEPSSLQTNLCLRKARGSYPCLRSTDATPRASRFVAGGEGLSLRRTNLSSSGVLGLRMGLP